MSDTNNRQRFSGIVPAACLLFILTLIIYGNSFHASWHLDDYHNILRAESIKVDNLDNDSLIGSLFFSRTGKLDRPVARLTLALNWYFGQRNVVGYHIVNITIHFLTSVFLFITILSIFKTPRLQENSSQSAYLIALLASVFWAVNPIQTQAVTYIVQRMAALAAMFYLLGIFAYIKGRTADSKSGCTAAFIGCFLCSILALGSKENAILMPPTLVLVEFIFFQDLGEQRSRKRFLIVVLLGTGIIIALGSLFFIHGSPLKLLNYMDRPWTAGQRLMTQPRILLYYLTQIFYPVPERLSIEHDVDVSTSLLHPWTTLPAMGLVAAFVLAGILLARKRPLVSFAILFYFLNHAVESSVIGLELMYEHRNYLPSAFLFAPVSAGIWWAIEYYRKQKPYMVPVIAGSLVLLLISLGVGTHIRNRVWATEWSLWTDALKKAPAMSRPVINLACQYYEKTGQLAKALDYYRHSTKLKVHRLSARAIPYNNSASIYYQTGNYRQALEMMQEACDISPGQEVYQYRMARILAKLGRWDRANSLLNTLLAGHPRLYAAHRLKGFVALNQNKTNRALDEFRLCLLQNAADAQVYMLAGVALGLANELPRAELFFKQALVLVPEDFMTMARLIEINLRTEDAAEVERYTRRLIRKAPGGKVMEVTKAMASDLFLDPDSRQAMLDTIAAALDANTDTVNLYKDPKRSIANIGQTK